MGKSIDGSKMKELAAYIMKKEHEGLRQDTKVTKEYFDFIREYDKNNIPIGVCEFLDRHLLDDESYRIVASIIMAAGGCNYASAEEVDRILGANHHGLMDNHTATRWEAMRVTKLAHTPDDDDMFEIDPTKLGRYIRFMGLTNPFEEEVT